MVRDRINAIGKLSRMIDKERDDTSAYQIRRREED